MAELMQRIVRWMDDPVFGPDIWPHGRAMCVSKDDAPEQPAKPAKVAAALRSRRQQMLSMQNALAKAATAEIVRNGPISAQQIGNEIGEDRLVVFHALVNEAKTNIRLGSYKPRNQQTFWFDAESIIQRAEMAKKASPLSADIVRLMGNGFTQKKELATKFNCTNAAFNGALRALLSFGVIVASLDGKSFRKAWNG